MLHQRAQTAHRWLAQNAVCERGAFVKEASIEFDIVAEIGDNNAV